MTTRLPDCAFPSCGKAATHKMFAMGRAVYTFFCAEHFNSTREEKERIEMGTSQWEELDPTTEDKETVDHPEHYGGDTPYETIKVLAEWMTEEQLVGFCIGNSVKYLSRAGKKGDQLEDWKKARWYVSWLIERLEGKPSETPRPV